MGDLGDQTVEKSLNFCRLCADESDDTIQIFSEKGQEVCLPEKINKCLPIVVSTSLIFTHFLPPSGNKQLVPSPCILLFSTRLISADVLLSNITSPAGHGTKRVRFGTKSNNPASKRIDSAAVVYNDSHIEGQLLMAGRAHFVRQSLLYYSIAAALNAI